MAAGGSAYKRAQQQRDKALELTRQAHAAHAEATRYATASRGEQRVYAALLVLQGQGWRLLADRRWPGTRSANVDMIMVGPSGIYVIDVKSWRDRPMNRGGHLY